MKCSGHACSDECFGLMKCQYFPGPGQELSPLLSVSVRQADTGTEQVVVVKHTHSSVPRSPFGMLKKQGFCLIIRCF